MSIIQAYKSDSDGKLFEDKSKYISHLKKLASVRRAKKQQQKVESEREKFLDIMGQVQSIEDLEKFIKDNWKWFWINASKHNSWRGKNSIHFHEYVQVYFSNLVWTEKVSNSHSCPRGGVQNFDTRSEHNKDKPTGYPGWSGTVKIKVRPPMTKHGGKLYMLDGWGSYYFADTIINTGSGGGGGGKDCREYSYEVRLYAVDFPVMYENLRRKQYNEKENHNRQLVWKSLGGQGQAPLCTGVPDDWVCPSPWVAG